MARKYNLNAISQDLSNVSLDERLERANVGFKPLFVQTEYRLPGSSKYLLSESWSIVADNNGREVGSGHKRGYKITPYIDVFSKFDDGLIQAGLIPCGVQSFRGGGGARAFYKTSPTNGKLNVGDNVALFSIHTSYDGLWSTGFSGMLLQVACLNGLCREKWSMKSAGVRHTRNHDLRLNDAIESFNWIGADMVLTTQLMGQFVKPIDIGLIGEFTAHMIPNKPVKEGEVKRDNKARENQRNALSAHIVESAVIRGRKITFEDLINGVTSYNTHEKDEKAETVFERLLTGKGLSVESAFEFVQVRA